MYEEKGGSVGRIILQKRKVLSLSLKLLSTACILSVVFIMLVYTVVSYVVSN